MKAPPLLTRFQHRNIPSLFFFFFCIFPPVLFLFFPRLYYFGCLPSPGPPVQQASCHRWTPNKRYEMPKFQSQLPGEKVRMCFPFDPLGVGALLESCISSLFPPLHQTWTSVCWQRFTLEKRCSALVCRYYNTLHSLRCSRAWWCIIKLLCSKQITFYYREFKERKKTPECCS